MKIWMAAIWNIWMGSKMDKVMKMIMLTWKRKEDYVHVAFRFTNVVAEY